MSTNFELQSLNYSMEIMILMYAYLYICMLKRQLVVMQATVPLIFHINMLRKSINILHNYNFHIIKKSILQNKKPLSRQVSSDI